MFYRFSHEKNQSEHDYGSSGGRYALPSNSTTEALVLLSANIYLFAFWLQALEQNSLECYNMYIFAIKKLITKTPVEIPKPSIPKEKYQYLLHAIGGCW